MKSGALRSAKTADPIDQESGRFGAVRRMGWRGFCSFRAANTFHVAFAISFMSALSRFGCRRHEKLSFVPAKTPYPIDQEKKKIPFNNPSITEEIIINY